MTRRWKEIRGEKKEGGQIEGAEDERMTARMRRRRETEAG